MKSWLIPQTCLGCSSSTMSHDLLLHLIWVLVPGLLPSECPPHLTSLSFDHTPSPYSALISFRSVVKCLKHGLIISLHLFPDDLSMTGQVSAPGAYQVQWTKDSEHTKPKKGTWHSLEMLSSDRRGRVRRTKHTKKKARGHRSGTVG